MSQHDLVSAQTSTVCITQHAVLIAIVYIVCVKQFVMSLQQFPWEIGSVRAWWDRVRWVGIYNQRVKQHGCVWFGCKNPSVGSLHKWSWKPVILPHRASMKCSSAIYLLELASIA